MSISRVKSDKKLPALVKWIDDRFPLVEVWQKHFSEYYVAKNVNFWYAFGLLATVIMIMQVLTGIFLTMNYIPDASKAFDSVEYIMRDVNWGWLLRYIHAIGASFFFIVIYLHMFRGLIYGSHRKPRELVWIIGVALYLLLIMLALTGYMLPWGQLSYWASQVVISIIESIPFIGDGFATWIRGDYVISGVTLNRFFALHVAALPVAMFALVFLHIMALHSVGSSNPEGVDIEKYKDANGKPLDGIAFFPYVVMKDLFALSIFLIVFFAVIFFAPEGGGYFLEKDNFDMANSLKTPEHIAPSWYLMPYYSMLRAVPSMFGSQFPGAFVMLIAPFMWIFLPWLDRSPVDSLRYRGWISKAWVAILTISFIVLGWLGGLPAEGVYIYLARFFTILYFAFFLAMPIYTRLDSYKPVPDRILK